MADTCHGESEINTQDETSTSTKKHRSKKPCSSVIQNGNGETSERKKVYRSIFGPEATSDSDSNTFESSCSSESEETDLQTGDKNSPAKSEIADQSMKEFDGMSSKEHVEDMQTSQNVVDNKSKDACFDGIKKSIEMAKEFEQQFLSPEEKEALSHLALSHIAEELSKRQADNEETSTRLYTGPYGRIQSPFKKFSSFHGFPSGIKRSPRKLAGPAAKRTKLFHDDEDTGESSSTEGSPAEDATHRHTPVDNRESNEASGTESTDEDKLEIVEDDHSSEFDRKLEDKSSKFSLTVVNVKSIIHKIVTNENVIEMVRKAVEEEMDEHESRFEPKMTRSKLKEFEAQGQVPHSWGLSPRKKRESPNFLEMELPDDEEDDEDFNPDKIVLESDEDSESVLSSCLSDIGSPMPSTPKSLPSTPKVTSSPSVSTSLAGDSDTSLMDENSSQSFLSPMGPPLQTCVPKSQNISSSGLGKKYQDAMEREKQKREEEEELIASRTRSKYPLKDCSILDIEANFVAPDITQDMYDTCDDYDWAEFLSTLIRFPDDDTLTNNLNTTNEEEDTEDDPEYNFQAEIDRFELDREDFRDDRAVKVSRKEVNELLDDILNDDNEDDVIDEQYKITIKTQSAKIVFNSNHKKQTEYQQSMISAIGQYERKQIDDQLRKHVQQLAQTHMMAQNGIDEHKPMADTAKFYLNELSNFAARSETLYGRTAFRVCNLEHALCLLDDEKQQEVEELSQQDKDRLEAIAFKYDTQYLPAFTFEKIQSLWTSPVFMFPELLPHGGFFKYRDIKRDRARVKFLESEDNLLAMGIAQFSHLKNDAKDYIQRFMLPCKSRKQIEIRIKNLKAKASKDNAVKFYKKHKKLPRFPQHAPEFDVSMMKSLKDSGYDWNELPLWCRFFCSEDQSLLNESVREQQERQKERKRRRKERQTASFSLSDSDGLPMYTPPHPSASAPVTPHQQTDSSVSGSSGSESTVNFLPVKRKRLGRQSRKRLNMSKDKKPGAVSVGSFVPLSLSGTNILQQTPLTICVLDSMQRVVPGSAAISPCIGTLPANNTGTCATPTVVVINKNAPGAPLQVQSFNQTLTFTSSHTFPQTGTQFTQSPSVVSQTVPPVVSQTVPDVNVNSTKNDSEIDGKSLTFEDICRPIMEAEMAAGEVMPSCVNDKELCTLYTENGSVVSVNPVKNDVIVNIVENVGCNTTNLPAAPVCSGPTGSGDALNDQSANTTQNVDLQSRNRTGDEVQSSEISSSTVLKTLPEADLELQTCAQEVHFKETATSPFTVNDDGQEVTVPKEVFSPTGELERDTTLTDSSVAQCSCTPTRELYTQTSFNGEMTPKQSNPSPDVSSCEKTPKSSLEVVAALAPYFISPIHSSGSLQHALERTPTKRQLPTLAPKSVSPSQRTVPISFSDLSPAKRKLKVKSSPRKKHLQQQVKTILPKGFVISSFDTSPAKKAASSLVDRAKQRANHSKGFCKILPRPPNLVNVNISQESLFSKASRRGTARVKVKGASNENNSTKESGIDTQSEDLSDNIVDDVTANNSAVVDDDDRCGDTESDYTQSEDGNETQGTDGEDGDTQGTDDGEGTQGTDGDSQDSQEEDNHIADLMAASTTMGFVPSRDDIYSRSRLGKKDRNRDLTLALLEPDIVEADPQRDLRDTLFAQAYIHKVKKAMRDDVDKLEQFLKIMYHFSQEGGSPVKLYKDVQELFSSHLELIYDFAGFLQPEQAIECGCYKAYQEFIHARTFLRKLEIYFNKNPNQLQKVMRTFSRWYKKPGRKESDLREQIEPMLKGQKMLLDDFSRFFPNERPSESLMDDFEEINLDDSGENEDKDTSFEEVELLDMEEVYGTKRCTCVCHDGGDDTYRKKKKHCYKCCLTVIDGELVYKVNKSTIKKINVTYGPPVKLSSLQSKDQSVDGKQEPVSSEIASQEPARAGCAIADTGDREPGNIDWFLDSETAEKENIEYFSERTRSERDGHQKKTNKVKSPPNKESFLQRISKLSRNKSQDKSARLSAVLKGKAPSPSMQEGQLSEVVQAEKSFQQLSNMEDMEMEYTKTEEKGKPETDKDSRVENNYPNKQMEMIQESIEVTTAKIKKSKSTAEIENCALQMKETEKIGNNLQFTGNKNISADKDSIDTNTTDETNVKSQELAAKNSDVAGVCRSNTSVPSDILASAFSSALHTEVSMDSLCFPFNMFDNNNKLSKEVTTNKELEEISEISNKTSTPLLSPENAIRPTVVSSVVNNSASVSAPVGQNSLHVSTDSSFQKVPSSDNIVPLHNETEKDKESEIQNMEMETDQISQQTDVKEGEIETPAHDEKDDQIETPAYDEKEDRIETQALKQVSKIDQALDISKSPPFSPFSPFSPFAQEIQSITSLQSPLSAVQSPGITRSLSSSGKVRRITPIPVKGSEGKTDSQSSFQTAMENSPVLPDLPVSSPSQNTQSAESKSVDSVTNFSNNSADNSHGFSGKVEIGSFAADSGSDSQKLEVSSQKSNSNTAETSSSQTSVTSDQPYTRTIISKPDIFSENANVGFPKLKPAETNFEARHSGILSEESLFHCLSKPPEFIETIPNVSNLTNILNALDGHSHGSELHVPSQEHIIQGESEKDDNDASPVNDNTKRNVADFDSGALAKAVDEAHSLNVAVVKESDKQVMDVVPESANDSSSVHSSGNSSEGQVDSVHPQSVESIENLKRLKTGLFKVSRLSDSDTSGVSTPSSSATNILNKDSTVQQVAKLKFMHETDSVLNKVSRAVEEITNIDERAKPKDNEPFRTEAMESEMKIGEEVIRKSFESGNDNMTDTGSESKRKKRKMSRRELKRSLQGKEIPSPRSDYEDGEVATNEDEEEESETNECSNVEESERVRILEDATVVQCKIETESADDVIESSKKVEMNRGGSESELPVKSVCETVVADDGLREIKIEEPDMFDNAGVSDVQSISDSVSEASSRGHKKSKHKRKHKSDKDRSHKKKRRKEDKESDSTSKTEKKKKKKSKRREQEEPNLCGEKTISSDQEKVITEDVKDVVQQTVCNTTDTAPAVADEEGASEVSQTEVEEHQMTEDPEWTKETDRTILETCKVHGIKEKTFAKIAKRIGHVTAKQVRKRFEQLYTIIFGHQFGEKTDK